MSGVMNPFDTLFGVVRMVVVVEPDADVAVVRRDVSARVHAPADFDDVCAKCVFGALVHCDVSVGGREAVERLPGLPAFQALRRDLDEPLPDLGGALEILLAECAHDAQVQQRLRVLRIDLQRVLELLDRQIWLVVVVVAHAEIGADARRPSG